METIRPPRPPDPLAEEIALVYGTALVRAAQDIGLPPEGILELGNRFAERLGELVAEQYSRTPAEDSHTPHD